MTTGSKVKGVGESELSGEDMTRRSGVNPVLEVYYFKIQWEPE